MWGVATVVVRGWDRRVRLPLVVALVAAALLAGAFVGSRAVESDGAAGEVVVDETTNVVRKVELTPHGEFKLDVPVRLSESWGETLVSSNPEVVQVVDDGEVRTGEPGTATLSVRNDTGQSVRMFEVTVTG